MGGGAVSYREKPVASRPNTVTLDLKLPNECEIGIRKCLNDMNDMVYKIYCYLFKLFSLSFSMIDYLIPGYLQTIL